METLSSISRMYNIFRQMVNTTALVKYVNINEKVETGRCY